MTKKQYERPIITKQQSGFMNKFGAATVTLPKTEIDGISVKELVENFGSPLFVISERTLREKQRNALRIFKTRYPKVQFAWSYKTNYLNAVCSVFHQEGSWAEVVSEFEYDKAKKLGVSGKHIFYNGPHKSNESLTKAINDGAKIHIDHFDELYQLIELTEKFGKKANVAIRVNMDVGIFPKWDRFGFNFENGEAAQALKRIIVSDSLVLTGLHMHIGTYMMSTEAYRIGVNKLVSLANELYKNNGIILDYIDIGGGFPSNNTLKGQYLPAEQILPSIEQFADAITSELFSLKYDKKDLPTLVLETGRALVDDAGSLISTVLATKRLSDGKRALIFDAGVNILFTSFWYKHLISPGQKTGAFTEDAKVFGPLCMNIDCINENMTLPSLKKNDLVVIQRVGAYNMTQWMQFITTRPNVVMIMENGSVELIRQAEDLEYIMMKERLPEKLRLTAKK